MRILCYGDSDTYGHDPRSPLGKPYPPDVRWTDRLARATGWEPGLFLVKNNAALFCGLNA